MARRRISLSSSILIGLALGIGCGLLFGEYCAFLKVVGNAFIQLLQMSILPYITFALMAGIGQMTFAHAKVVAVRAGLVLLAIWGVSLGLVLLLPLAFPAWESASFFSSSVVEMKESPDLISTYIPANPFWALANNVVPAVVLFSIAVGIALIGIKDKEKLVDALQVLSDALTRVAHAVVKLTPVGVFAISASAAGTLTVEEFGRLQVYFVAFIVGAFLLAFWILPLLVTTFTPFRYRDVVRACRDAAVTAFTTGNLFIVLPILVENTKELFAKYDLTGEDATSSVDILVPLSYNFPNAGKLLILLFILFAAWFSGDAMSPANYPVFAVTGLFSFFASAHVGIPFLLDAARLPTDLYQLYVVTDLINSRFASLVAAMSLLTFTLLAACAVTGTLSLSWKKVTRYLAGTGAVVVAIVLGTRAVLGHTVDNTYQKDQVIAAMQLLDDPAPVVVHREPQPPPAGEDGATTALPRIRKRGAVRVGYVPDRLPFTYFNAEGDLVGLDAELAHRLAKDLEVALVLVPTSAGDLARDLDEGVVDVVMSGVPVTPHRAERVGLTISYLDMTLALVVRDHRREEFATRDAVLRKEFRLAVPGEGYFAQRAREVLPHADVVALGSAREFFEKSGELDALLTAAEVGSAWTLLYPEYSVVVPQPLRYRIPVAFAVARRDREFLTYLDRWVEMKVKSGIVPRAFDHWILGKDAVPSRPRWSVIRDVLHWVD
ncbi:MAG: cation:dicarboxylate symporter family transporter [Planctomycetota bacterium]|jgi:Na+/H+-dicarboxylate symporter